MIADERSNSLLIYASKADMKIIKEIIAKLDTVLPQVLIEAVIIEVNLNKDRQIGVSYLEKQPHPSSGYFRGIGAINNGNTFSPIATAVLFPESVSHVPGTAGSAGTETLSRTSDEIRSTEKATPATAAARGVLRALPAASGPWPAGSWVMGVPFRGRVLSFELFRHMRRAAV